MQKHVGVLQLGTLLSPEVVKQFILYFDEICLAHLDLQGTRIDPPEADALYRYLLDQPFCSAETFSLDFIMPRLEDAFERGWGSMMNAAMELGPKRLPVVQAGVYQQEAAKKIVDVSGATKRATCTYRVPQEFQAAFETPRANQECIQILARQFPVPPESVPIEDLVSFRTESETQEELRWFRRWERKIIEAETDPLEAVEELNDMVSAREKRLRLLSRERRIACVELVFKLPVSLVEAFIKLELSGALDPLFAFMKTRVAFDEKALGLPGKEVAYIAEAKSRFQK